MTGAAAGSFGFPGGKHIAVIATMDTKGREAAYIAAYVRERGHEAILIDVGPLSGAFAGAAYGCAEVARRSGAKLCELVAHGSRERIMQAMGDGAGAVLLELLSDGRLDGVLGIGGNQGSAVASAAMRKLPIGFPKLLVSTVASGNIRPYIGASDIAVVFSIADLVGGPNAVSGPVLRNAAAALIGMAENGRPIAIDDPARTIALSALGNTEPAVERIAAALEREGYAVITFHASGAGGSAMEELIGRGVFGGVIDLTTHELAEESAGVGAYTPVRPGRLTAAGRAGIPQVVSFGGLEYLCFGPRESIPPAYRDRKIYMHNPLNANLKLTVQEMERTGRLMAERLNGSAGPVRVLVPLQGWSVYGQEGGPLYEPEGNAALLRELKRNLHDRIGVGELDLHINDPAFAEACVEALLAMMRNRPAAEQTAPPRAIPERGET